MKVNSKPWEERGKVELGSPPLQGLGVLRVVCLTAAGSTCLWGDDVQQGVIQLLIV